MTCLPELIGTETSGTLYWLVSTPCPAEITKYPSFALFATMAAAAPAAMTLAAMVVKTQFPLRISGGKEVRALRQKENKGSAKGRSGGSDSTLITPTLSASTPVEDHYCPSDSSGEGAAAILRRGGPGNQIDQRRDISGRCCSHPIYSILLALFGQDGSP